jgi:hypothetical protein
VGRIGKQPPRALLSPYRAGRKQLQAETRDWEQTAAIIARFFNVKAEDLA